MQGCFLCTHTICCSTIGIFSTTQSYTHLPCATSYSNPSAHTLHARESTPLHPLLPPLQTPGVLWELVCFLHTTRYHTPPIHIHARCRDTGTTGSIAARVAITRAQRQLAVEAGIHLNIQSFQVFNSVGAVNLKASLNCDAFASNHSADAHYDRASFVGLAVFLLLGSNSHPSLVHHLNAIAPPTFRHSGVLLEKVFAAVCCQHSNFIPTSRRPRVPAHSLTSHPVCVCTEIYSTGKGKCGTSAAPASPPTEVYARFLSAPLPTLLPPSSQSPRLCCPAPAP